MFSKLTKAEEEVMQVIWQLERATVSQMLEKFGQPAPPHSTISSIVRILEKKGFVTHKAYGRTHDYFALISKEEYSKKSLKAFVGSYFEGSMHQLVSFLVKEEDLGLNELAELIEGLDQEKKEQ